MPSEVVFGVFWAPHPVPEIPLPADQGALVDMLESGGTDFGVIVRGNWTSRLPCTAIILYAGLGIMGPLCPV